MTIIKLSALVVARNEESHLNDCLNTLKFADEIVVVLDRSIDNSNIIAQAYTKIIVNGSWPIEGDRRNIGIERCSGEWILEVDADERVTGKLSDEILIQINNSKIDYFQIPFDNYIGDKLVRYGWGCSWGVSSAPRLFRKSFKIWGRQRIHPSVQLKGKRGYLKQRMIHYVDEDISDMLKRLDRYTDAKALDLFDSGELGSLLNNIRRFFSRFIKCYFLRKGFREGYYGFLIALMAALYPILSYLKASIKEQ